MDHEIEIIYIHFMIFLLIYQNKYFLNYGIKLNNIIISKKDNPFQITLTMKILDIFQNK